MQRLLLLLLLGLQLSPSNAQNLNTTFRSKMSFPGQTLANIWGYTGRSGVEYALLGASLGMIIVDISNPDAPKEIVQIEGPHNLWKEIKTYSHYAYIVSEGGNGIQIVNLDSLPSPNLSWHYYTGDGAVKNQIWALHALHIDVNKGFLYAWGGPLFDGGAKVFDLKQDPYNPVYVGKYDALGYIHDGFVDNDTMYSAHIYKGYFAAINMADKNAPQLMGSQSTPSSFTHNVWPSDDRRTLFTTDETNNSYLAAYDISNLEDITLLDKIQSNPGSNSVVHNTYVLKNWAVTSWYKDGITIVDVTRPDNLVQVGNYDTYGGSGGGYDGCWGVYPFFKSRTLIASNIKRQGTNDGELFLITPDYHRACYLEGSVTNGVNGQPLNNALIEIVEGTTTLMEDISGTTGVYKIGQAKSGYFKVRVSKNAYSTYETTAYLAEGEVTILNVTLFPENDLVVSGTVLSKGDFLPVTGAVVQLCGPLNVSMDITDGDGSFSFSGVQPGIYDITANLPGTGFAMLSQKKIIGDSEFTLLLSGIVKRDAGYHMLSMENPFAGTGVLTYKTLEANCTLNVLNSVGQLLQTRVLEDQIGQIQLGQELPKGIYFVRLSLGDQLLETLKVVKTE